MPINHEIPAQVGTITPYFTVTDPDALIGFATEVFGAKIVKENRYDTGELQHARLQIDDALIMVNQATEAYAANVSQIHLYVGDVDACYRKALDHDAASLMAPNVRPHGEKMAGLKDPCSNIWWIAERG